MSPHTADKILDWLQGNPEIETVDLTGGSPEANSEFRRIVEEVTRLGLNVMDRCNPTIIGASGINQQTFEWVPQFLADHRVTVVASLPCYLEDNVRKQRGMGAYEASVAGLQALNAVGYASDPELILNLVYNPVGPHLPPEPEGLEADYRRELAALFGIRFNSLWTITNMPISRWKADLQRQGKLEAYMELLENSYNPSTVDHLMCRTQIHVDSQGNVFDCDFNYAMGLASPIAHGRKLWELSAQELQNRAIATDRHCLGCTAGSGSSCTGSLV